VRKKKPRKGQKASTPRKSRTSPRPKSKTTKKSRPYDGPVTGARGRVSDKSKRRKASSTGKKSGTASKRRKASSTGKKKSRPLRGGSLARSGARSSTKRRKASSPQGTGRKKAKSKSSSRTPAQGRARARKPASLQGTQGSQGLELEKARVGEAYAALDREITRRKLKKRAPKQVRERMKQELAGLLDSARFAGRAMGLSKDDIRGYAYEDGRVVARMRIPLPNGVGARAKILDIQENLFLPEGTFLEANFLLDTEHMMRQGFEPRPNNYLNFKRFHRAQLWSGVVMPRKLSRIQFWGSQNKAGVGVAMLSVLENMHKAGFRQPEALYLRLGRTSQPILDQYAKATTRPDGSFLPKEERIKKGLVDPSQPFQRYAPPVGGTLVRKRKPQMPSPGASPAGRPAGARGRASGGKKRRKSKKPSRRRKS
jgi:hypothetical protein